MGIEIERKFLINREKITKVLLSDGKEIQQGYLCDSPTVRIRLMGGEGFLTVKGPGLESRMEVEVKISFSDATALLSLCPKVLTKFRYLVTTVERGADRLPTSFSKWEIDYFPQLDLWLAELEGQTLDSHTKRPEWILREVTGDATYQNVNLIKRVP